MERSELIDKTGWIVTGGLRTSMVEMYKLSQYEAGMFSSYSVSLQVLRGGANASQLKPRLTVSAIKAYALLPSFLGLVGLILLIGFTAIGIGIAHFIVYRRTQRRASEAS